MGDQGVSDNWNNVQFDRCSDSYSELCNFFSCPILLLSLPLCGGLALSGPSLLLGQVHPLQLLYRRLSVITDDVVVAVLVCRVVYSDAY